MNNIEQKFKIWIKDYKTIYKLRVQNHSGLNHFNLIYRKSTVNLSF